MAATTGAFDPAADFGYKGGTAKETGGTMAKHRHNFVENYDGLLGFGYDRRTDENTVRCYLQKFSDDRLMDVLIPKLSDGELEEIFNLVARILKNHLTENEYHTHFLKDKHHDHG